MSEAQRDRLRKRTRTMTFDKGAPVFSQGEICRQVYYICSGIVKLSYLTLGGKEMIKSFISEEQMFGSLQSQLTGGESTFSAIALEPLTVDVLDYSELQKIIDNNPQTQKLMLYFFQQLSLKKEKREYELLCLSAGLRYQKLCEENPGLVRRIKQVDLAHYLGITPIALSRLKHRDL